MGRRQAKEFQMGGRVFGVAIGAAILLAVGLGASAQADQVCNDLNSCTYNIDVWKGSPPTPPNAPWGTIVLTQGAGFVDISLYSTGVTHLQTRARASPFCSISAKRLLLQTSQIWTPGSRLIQVLGIRMEQGTGTTGSFARAARAGRMRLTQACILTSPA